MRLSHLSKLSDLSVIVHEFISSICKEFDKYSDEHLMKMSQNKGMPWEVVWNNGNGRFNEISTNLMKILFKEKYET